MGVRWEWNNWPSRRACACVGRGVRRSEGEFEAFTKVSFPSGQPSPYNLELEILCRSLLRGRCGHLLHKVELLQTWVCNFCPLAATPPGLRIEGWVRGACPKRKRGLAGGEGGLYCHWVLCPLPSAHSCSLARQFYWVSSSTEKLWLYLGLGRFTEVDSHLVGTFSVWCSEVSLVYSEQKLCHLTVGFVFFPPFDLIRVFCKFFRWMVLENLEVSSE